MTTTTYNDNNTSTSMSVAHASSGAMRRTWTGSPFLSGDVIFETLHLALKGRLSLLLRSEPQGAAARFARPPRSQSRCARPDIVLLCAGPLRCTADSKAGEQHTLE